MTEVLSARLEQLRAGAEPTGGDPSAPRPEQHGRTTGSPVSPATSSRPFSPPPRGTPDQRGRPKGECTQELPRARRTGSVRRARGGEAVCR
ncbi:hypothetical protein [Streptomyces sp. NPDC001759]